MHGTKREEKRNSKKWNKGGRSSLRLRSEKAPPFIFFTRKEVDDPMKKDKLRSHGCALIGPIA